MQWYLARDGQQFGPISDAELARFIELGHMQPNDLLWREGFPDWRPAMVVFPPRAQPAGPRPNPQTRQTSDSLQLRPDVDAPADARRDDMEREAVRGEIEREPRRGRFMRMAMVLLVLVALGAVVWFALPYRDRLWGTIGSLSSLATSDAHAIADRKSLQAAPLAGFTDSPEATDIKLQETALWRVIKREFPDWYNQRLTEAAELARSSKDPAAVGQQMARRIMELRRQQVAHALAATLPRLKTVASTFYDNLVELRRHSTDACYGFISQGETNPAIVKNMQLFSSERALAQAAPDKVCQLVHDWFAAQLALDDGEAQMRLLVESLRPVVAG
jgi:hypothetical protein